jgi:hypothetical protein
MDASTYTFAHEYIIIRGTISSAADAVTTDIVAREGAVAVAEVLY